MNTRLPQQRLWAVALACLWAAVGCSRSQKPLVIKGSDTQLPIAQELSAAYTAKYPEANMTVVGGGSGVGIAALMSGTTDVAMSSRPLKTEERLRLTGVGITVKEAINAYDALAVIVNHKNPITQLTREQITEVFTGKIKNWKELGGNDLTIVVYSRESSSGTYEFFKDQVMRKKNFANYILSAPATGAMVQSIEQTEGAIGYVGLAYVTKGSDKLRAVKVSYDSGKSYILPSVAAAMSRAYPVTRPLFYYYNAKNSARVEPFINYALSNDGQKIVSDVGFVPVR